MARNCRFLRDFRGCGRPSERILTLLAVFSLVLGSVVSVLETAVADEREEGDAMIDDLMFTNFVVER
jgi:hypothetical protein